MTTQHQSQKNVFSKDKLIANKLPRDPSKAMQQMMSTIDDLKDIYVAETDALERMDSQAFLAMQENKINQAQVYEQGIKELISRKEEMKKVDPALKTKLSKMQDEFADLSQKNLIALDRMKRTMERLGGTIRNAAKEEAMKKRTFSYGQNGKFSGQNKNKKISLSVSEEV